MEYDHKSGKDVSESNKVIIFSKWGLNFMITFDVFSPAPWDRWLRPEHPVASLSSEDWSQDMQSWQEQLLEAFLGQHDQY